MCVCECEGEREREREREREGGMDGWMESNDTFDSAARGLSLGSWFLKLLVGE